MDATLKQALNHLWDESILEVRKRRDESFNGDGPRKFWASNVGGCLRKSLYAQAKVPETNLPGPGVIERMEIGNYVEAQVLAMLEERIVASGGTLDRQVRVENEYHMARTDAVMTLTQSLKWEDFQFAPGLPVPIEIKSMHPQAINRREKENDGLWEPYPHHILQLCQWIAIAQETGVPTGTRGILLYVSLDGRRRVSEVNFEDWRDELYNRWSDLTVHLLDDTLPKRMPNKMEFPCTYCNYRDHCWENFEPEWEERG